MEKNLVNDMCHFVKTDVTSFNCRTHNHFIRKTDWYLLSNCQITSHLLWQHFEVFSIFSRDNFEMFEMRPVYCSGWATKYSNKFYKSISFFITRKYKNLTLRNRYEGKIMIRDLKLICGDFMKLV